MGVADDFRDVAEQVGDLRDELADQTDEAVEDGMQRVTNEARSQLYLNDSVARGVTVSQLRTTEQTPERPDTIGRYATVAPPYAAYVEYGTGRSRQRGVVNEFRYKAPDPKPPFGPIYEWVVAKNIQPRSDEIETQTELAVAIQESIGDNGTRPHPFMRPAWASTGGKVNVVSETTQAIRRATRRSF